MKGGSTIIVVSPEDEDHFRAQLKGIVMEHLSSYDLRKHTLDVFHFCIPQTQLS